MQPSGNDPLSAHILRVEQIVVDLLRRKRLGLLSCRQEGASWFAVSRFRRDRNKLLFRVSQRRQSSAEDAAGVDVDSSVQPFGFRNRRMAVDDHRRAPVFGRPVTTHRQTEFVSLTSRFAVQSEVADLAGAASLHLFFHPGVGNDQFAVIQYVVTDKTIQKFGE